MIKDAITEIIDYTWPMILIVITIVVSIRIAYIITNKPKVYLYKEFINLGFIIYILSLFYVLTFQDVNYGTSNFTPFKEITRYEFGSKLFIKNVIGNVIMFTPLGFFISYYLKSKKFYLPLFLSALSSLVIEFTQSKIGRTFDIDDIILNIVGGLLGYNIYKFSKYLPGFTRKTWFLNIICIIIVILFIVYLLYVYGLNKIFI